MRSTKAKNATAPPEVSLSVPHEPKYELCLYVAGMTPRSVRAIANIRKICAERPNGRCNLRIIDLCQQPALAEEEQIVALPTLIRKLPPPLRRIIGDLSDRERVMTGLDLM